MRRLPMTAVFTAAALAFGVGLLVAPRPAAGGAPPQAAARIAAQPEYVLLQNRVAALEKSLAALQQNYGAHTHTYGLPGCRGFINLGTLAEALKHPAQANWGICMVQPSINTGTAPTSGPKS